MSDPEIEEDGNLRQRLWGAAVFIAAMVIVLPLLLDGAGSESQFRRVEKLREQPPGMADADAQRRLQVLAEMQSVGEDGATLTDPSDVANLNRRIRIGEEDPPDYLTAEQEVREVLERTRHRAALTAWVVQAGSFNDQQNALAVRDRLRRAGYASFVRDRDDVSEPFRVLVGPMISEASANRASEGVVKLLGVAALVVRYP